MNQFPKEFKKCPYCGYAGDAIATAAWKEKKGKVPNMQLSASRFAVPLIVFGSTNLVSPIQPCIIYHVDFCNSCGGQRCVKAEIADLPMPSPQAMAGIPGTNPKNPPLK